MPQPVNPVAKARERYRVPGDAVVPVVPAELRRQVRLLHADRPVPVCPKPVRDCFERTAEAFAGGLLLHHPAALKGPGPVVGETQQVEGTGRRRARPLSLAARTAEGHQPSLLGMEGEAVLAKTLGQHVQHPARIVFTFENDDEVISVANRKPDRATAAYLSNQVSSTHEGRCSPEAER